MADPSIEDRVKRVLAVIPTFAANDQVIALTVALAQGGTRVSQRIEQIASDIEGLNETRALLRKQYADLRDELELELAKVTAALADA